MMKKKKLSQSEREAQRLTKISASKFAISAMGVGPIITFPAKSKPDNTDPLTLSSESLMTPQPIFGVSPA